MRTTCTELVDPVVSAGRGELKLGFEEECPTRKCTHTPVLLSTWSPSTISVFSEISSSEFGREAMSSVTHI